jgi:hypothetical protein
LNTFKSSLQTYHADRCCGRLRTRCWMSFSALSARRRRPDAAYAAPCRATLWGPLGVADLDVRRRIGVWPPKLRRIARASAEPSMTTSRHAADQARARSDCRSAPTGRRLLANAPRLHWQTGRAIGPLALLEGATENGAPWCSRPVRGSRGVARSRACRRSMLAKRRARPCVFQTILCHIAMT